MRLSQILLSAVLFVSCKTSAAPSADNTATPLAHEEVAKNFFIGQAYPSGTIYLRPFPDGGRDDDDYQVRFAWPRVVNFSALGAEGAGKIKAGAAQYDNTRPMGPGGDHDYEVHIPSIEGMEIDEYCGADSANKKKNPNYRYIGGDFFWQVLDHCEPHKGLGIFKTSPFKNVSFSVIAVAGPLALNNMNYVDKQKRPLTDDEKQRLAEEKKATGSHGYECTTEPAYLDAAEIILEADVKGGDLRVRLSSYNNPGCGGHLESVYILDVLRNGALLRSYELSHYRGAV